MSSLCVILAAAGQSSRFKDAYTKKPFAGLCGKAVWLHSAELFLQRSDVKQLIIVIAEEDRVEFHEKFAANIAIHDIDVVIGGDQRSDSVQNALDHVEASIDYVVIHDAARPCIYDEMVNAVVEAARQHKVAIPTVPVHSTIKRSADGQMVDQTVDRANLYLSQTPQVFERKLLDELFANRGTIQPTDEAQLAEQLGKEIAMVPGSRLNIKITTPEDLELAATFMKALPKPKFDAPTHPFKDDHLWR